MASTRTDAAAPAPVADRATARSHETGLTISIRIGSGSGRTPLSAFDSALLDAGVGNFNLVTLSSVIPPASQIRHVKGPLPGTHGDLLFSVRAEAFADQPGHSAWAGLGWVTDETGGGLFVEHHGTTEASVVEQIEASLDDMNRSRGGRYGHPQLALSSVECVDEPVCALVVAAYRVTSWHDGGEPEPEADPVPPDAGLVATPPAASPATASGPGGTHTRVAEEWMAFDHGAQNGTVEPAPVEWSRPPGSPVARITVEKEVDYTTASRYYRIYAAIFGVLDTEAAGRQLLSEDEFLEEMLDPRVHKYIAWDDDGLAIGMSTLATDVSCLPWVSPNYFEKHYPEQHARGAIFYLGFTLVLPQYRSSGVFQLMIMRAIQHVVDNRGVAAWDSCQANDDRGMNAAAIRMIEELGHVTAAVIDRQTYYAAVLGEVGETPARDRPPT